MRKKKRAAEPGPQDEPKKPVVDWDPAVAHPTGVKDLGWGDEGIDDPPRPPSGK